MPVFEDNDCKCVEFTDYWIFSYGDTVTLLLTFFILLFTFCKLDVEKFKSVAESFKPLPPGTPFFFEGKEGAIEAIAQQLDDSELSEETFITIDERGVVVSMQDRAIFALGSAEISEKGIKTLDRFAKFIYGLPNKVAIEGHTDDQPISSRLYPSNWELSSARGGAVARWFEQNGVEAKRMEVIGYGSTKPRFRNDSPEKRALNRRVEIVIKPE